MERQGAEGGVAAGTAAADKRALRVDQLALGQVPDHGAGIFDVNLAPAQVQGLAIVPAIAAAATVIEVGHGEAALGPELDARIEHRIAGRGRPAMQEHHQRRLFAGRHHTGGVARRVEEGVGLLALAAGKAQRLGTGQFGCGQRLLAAGEKAHRPRIAGDGQHRRQAVRRAGDAVEMLLVRRQLAEAAELDGQTPLAAAVVALDQQAPALLQPAQQQPVRRQRKVADGAQLPGCGGVVGAGHGQRLAPAAADAIVHPAHRLGSSGRRPAPGAMLLSP
ncbi:hypothetical protein D3C84_427010 [compost metagenome]